MGEKENKITNKQFLNLYFKSSAVKLNIFLLLSQRNRVKNDTHVV